MLSSRWLFVVLYTMSGAAALVYEVTWTRLLTLQMGHTVSAVSTVLAAFMGGLAIGAWIAGRFKVGRAQRLRTYAILEILIALIAIALPLALGATGPVIAWAYANGDAMMRFAFVRAGLSFILLAVPAAAMGATFPIAAAWFADLTARLKPGAVARSFAEASVLYAANTGGAAAGAIGAGFWLIPSVGLRGTTWIGVALNAGAALGALWLARRDTVSTAAPAQAGITPEIGKDKRKKGQQPRRDRSSPLPDPRPVLAWTAAALSGFTALVFEVSFTRLLALVIGPTTYAFATMAASFIAGLAIGSTAGARLSRRISRPAYWLAAALAVTAVSGSLAASYAASRLPLVVAAEVAASTVTFESVVLRQALDVALLMLPMTFALGAAFPLALATASCGTDSVGPDTARVYVANTLGAISGSLAAGFLLVPRFGLHATFSGTSRVAIVGAVAIAVWATIASPDRNLAPHRLLPRVPGVLRGGELTSATRAKSFAVVMALVVIGVLAAVFVAVPTWDRELLSSGAYKYAPYIHASEANDFEASLRAGRLEYYKEGAAATVSVRRLAGRLSLAIDGKVDASNAGDMLTQRLLGVLPVFIHGHPDQLCVIGLGSGVTVASAMATGLVRHADVVEISPEVVAASAFFSNENNDILESPKVRLIVGDGRSHLQLSNDRYDVIVSEPSNPWMAGVAALFTREFFAAARLKLEPGGILCQWAHTYDMSDADLRSIVRTFAAVFPQSTMWRVGDGDLLLIGTTGSDIDAQLANIAKRARQPSTSAVLSDVGIEPATAPFQLLSLFAGGPAEVAHYGDAATVQTDNRMALEFSAPTSIYGRSTSTNAKTIQELIIGARLPAAVASAMHGADAKSLAARAAMDLKAEAYSSAYDYFRKAIALDNRDADALRGASDAAAGLNQQAEHRAWLEELTKSAPTDAPVRVELSRVRAAAGDFDGAIEAATEAQRLEPNDPRATEQLASVFADMGDAARLAPLADFLVSRYPNRADGIYYQATVLLLRDRPAEAATLARRVVAVNPQSAKAQNLLGAACASTGQRECAEAAFAASIRLNPREPSSYVNLGLFYLQTARPESAADAFGEALSLDPSSAAARDGLRQARAALPSQ
jgi:spermidine synthase